MEWLNPKEYLPSDDGFVFVVLQNDAFAVRPYCDGEFLGSVLGSKIRVKYWMPIPPLPRKGKNA